MVRYQLSHLRRNWSFAICFMQKVFKMFKYWYESVTIHIRSKCLPVHDDSMNTQWFCIFIWKLIWHLFQSEVELSGRSVQYFPCLLLCWSIWLITRHLNRVFRCAIGGVASVLSCYSVWIWSGLFKSQCNSPRLGTIEDEPCFTRSKTFT